MEIAYAKQNFGMIRFHSLAKLAIEHVGLVKKCLCKTEVVVLIARFTQGVFNLVSWIAKIVFVKFHILMIPLAQNVNRVLFRVRHVIA